MTSQPGAGGDAVVAWAQDVARWSDEPGAEPERVNAVRFARWIVRWSDTVAAAVKLEHAEAERVAASAAIGTKDDDVARPFAARRELAIATTELYDAVRSALTHRDEKEGG